jgi:hypothetical protein
MNIYLQVSMGNSVLMQILQKVYDLSYVKSTYFVGQVLNIFLHKSHKLSDVTKLHYKVQFIFVLESVL